MDVEWLLASTPSPGKPSDRAMTSRTASLRPRGYASSRSRRASAGVQTITVTRNEVLYSLNKPDNFILAIVEFGADGNHRTYYVRRPFQREPDFAVVSQNYSFAELIAGHERAWDSSN